MKKCFLDLETTGFDAHEDSIIEVAFIIQNEDGSELRYDAVVRPERSPLNPTVTAITGITQAEINEIGRDWNEVKNEITPLLEGTVIIGHNINFDIRFLRAHGVPVPENAYIDTHQLARILLINEESYSLESIAGNYCLMHENAHRAMSDVEASEGLFRLLQKEIESLPKTVLEPMKALIGRHKNWVAGALFSGQSGTNETPQKPDYKPFQLPTAMAEKIESYTTWHAILDAPIAAAKLIATAEATAKAGQKSIIITPKMSYFGAVKAFPTPEVLLSPERLMAFCMDNLSDDRLVFALKCLHRHAHGLRGLRHINLFFEERPLWQSVHMTDEEYAPVQVEKLTEPVLAMSARAYAQWAHLFADRAIFIDEAEQTTKDLLMSATTTVSLWPWLEDPKTTDEALFTIAAVVKDIIEPLLKRPIGTYPERVPMPLHTDFSSILPRLEALGVMRQNPALETILKNPPEGVRIWLDYRPANGNLSFCWWTATDWMRLKTNLQQQPLHAWGHVSPVSSGFVDYWLGIKPEAKGGEKPHLQVQIGLPQVRSPHFIEAVAQRVLALRIDEKVSRTIISVSSKDLAQQLYFHLQAMAPDTKLMAEKITGGDGKILPQLKDLDEWIYIHHNSTHPNLSQLRAQQVIFPKFPFSAPNPLIAHLEQEERLWDAYTIPQTAANVLRRISFFGSEASAHMLDPRAQSGWGRGVITTYFV